MAEHKLFITNVLLLAALVAGASYLQKTYDTDRPQSAPAAAQSSPAVADDAGGWHLSTTTTQATEAPAAAPAPKPTPSRVYNREREDDDN